MLNAAIHHCSVQHWGATFTALARAMAVSAKFNPLKSQYSRDL